MFLAWKSAFKQEDSTGQLSREIQKTEGLRLCLHGLVVNPVLDVVPDALHFYDITVDTEEVRVLRLTNNSSLRFGFRYKKVPFVKIIPPTEYIDAGKSLEVTVKVEIRALGMRFGIL